MPVTEVRSGQTASFALKKIKRSHIRKGMVMVAPGLNPQSCWEFKGDIMVLHHPTTIATRYQAMVHCGSIRQTASITGMTAECLRTGDKANVHFRFVKHPEYLKVGQRLVFREGRTKAVGTVTGIVKHAPAGSSLHKGKLVKMTRNEQRNRGMTATAAMAAATTAAAAAAAQVTATPEAATTAAAPVATATLTTTPAATKVAN